jgi:hypothetical protein
MAAKKKAAKKKAKVLGNFDYVIDVVTDSAGDDRVVIVGKNDGNIRGKGGRKVTFVCSPNVTRFKIVCTEFPDNDDPSPPSAWPFEPPVMTGWLPEFDRKLAKPEKGASQLIFKYSIIVDDAIPADPAIIIDK